MISLEKPPPALVKSKQKDLQEKQAIEDCEKKKRERERDGAHAKREREREGAGKDPELRPAR